MTVRLVDVTPALAIRWLVTSRQKRLEEDKVARFAAAIHDGTWDPRLYPPDGRRHRPVLVAGGRLWQGNHRLHAIVRTGRTATMWVDDDKERGGSVKQAKEVHRAKNTFVADVDGRQRVIRRGDLLPGDDPVVKRLGRRFDLVSDYVEQATAAPGEKRSTPTRPQHACEECGETFGSAAALGSHKRVHADDE